MRLELGVENLLDKLYFLPTGGAYVGQASTMSMNGVPWGIPVPGPKADASGEGCRCRDCVAPRGLPSLGADRVDGL